MLAPTTLRNLVSLLRSVYASAVLDRLEATSPVVRHNASLVLSTYGYLMPDAEDRTRRAIDQAWSSHAPPVPHDEASAP